MLIKSPLPCRCPNTPSAQSGVVLFIALIILIAMTLAGIALVRSVDLTNIIAGNIAFKQAATRSGDTGIETGLNWLNDNPGLLVNDVPNSGYSANGNDPLRSPAAGQTWDQYWATLPAARIRTLPTDAAGNTVSIIIDRMCGNSGSPTGGANCTASTISSFATGSAEEGGEVSITAPSAVYYRITARIAGPRNTVSFVQAMVTR